MTRAVLFTRPPIPGLVKTRLIPALGAEDAAKLHLAMAEDTLGLLSGVPCTVALAGPLDHPWVATLRSRGHEVIAQVEGDLGAKMLAAMGPGPALALGTDAPTLPAAWIREAAEHPGPLTIGPAFDGGYYLLAWESPLPSLLRDIPWSTDAVCAETELRARAQAIEVRRLPFWYDVDTATDLALLRQHLRTLPPLTAPRTRAVLAALPPA